MNLDWVQNPWVTLTGWILGFLGVAIGIYYGVKGNRKKRLTCAIIQCNHLISKGRKFVSKLHLFFENEEIKDITVTTCVIWNTGTETINNTDIVPEHLIKIIPEKNCRILDARIVAINKATNDFCLNKNSEGEFELKFEYVDKNQGVTIEIVHEGNAVSFGCEIKGGTFTVSGRPDENNKINRWLNKNEKTPFFTLGVLASCSKIFALYSPVYLLCFVLGYLDQTGTIMLPEMFMSGIWKDLGVFSTNIPTMIFRTVMTITFSVGCAIIPYQLGYQKLPEELNWISSQVNSDLPIEEDSQLKTTKTNPRE